MVDRRMPRIQEVLLPYLREQLPGVAVSSWIPDVHYRQYPLLNVRRLGGQPVHPNLLDRPVIELTAYTEDGLPATENLYMDAKHVLWEMADKQILTDAGYIHSYFETMGTTQFDSPFDDTWRIQGLIQLGVRPRRGNKESNGA